MLTNFNQSNGTLLVKSFDDLRNTVPLFEGQVVKLIGWNSGSSLGSDKFTGYLSSGTDDGGTIASNGKNYHWERNKRDEDVDVLDFGAVNDGLTDCHLAIIAMFTWSQNKTNRFYRGVPAIRFPEGNFYFTPIDLSGTSCQHFAIHGPRVKFGYHPITTLTSDMSTNPFIKTASRTVEITGIIADGQNGTSVNTQPFFDNTAITGGTYYNLSQIWWQNFGGLLINVNDTLDTHIDQWYANSCVGGGFKIGYDNQSTGNWDHPTAVKLTNFNIQDCTTQPFFQAPRCLQSLINNGWIERSYGGDLSNGHWLVECLSVENCDKYGTLSFKDCRLTEINTNQLASTIIRGYDQSTAWQTSFQPGQTAINPYGVSTLGSLSCTWQTTPYFIRNNSATDAWYNIGKIWLNDSGDNFLIECIGEQGYNNAITENYQTYQVGYGIAKINMKRQSNNYMRGSWFSEGVSGVQDVAVVGGANQSTQIYVYVKAYSKIGIYIKTNTPGTNELTMINGEQTSTTINWQPVLTPAAVTTLPTGYEKLKSRWSTNVFSSDNSVYSGLGISSDGVTEIRTMGTTGFTPNTTVAGYLPVYIDGKKVLLPFYSPASS